MYVPLSFIYSTPRQLKVLCQPFFSRQQKENTFSLATLCRSLLTLSPRRLSLDLIECDATLICSLQLQWPLWLCLVSKVAFTQGKGARFMIIGQNIWEAPLDSPSLCLTVLTDLLFWAVTLNLNLLDKYEGHCVHTFSFSLQWRRRRKSIYDDKKCNNFCLSGRCVVCLFPVSLSALFAFHFFNHQRANTHIRFGPFLWGQHLNDFGENLKAV